jgi:Flp pilus assembly protein TadB
VQSLLTKDLGQTLLAAAVVLELVGLAWVVRMLRTDY